MSRRNQGRSHKVSEQNNSGRRNPIKLIIRIPVFVAIFIAVDRIVSLLDSLDGVLL